MHNFWIVARHEYRHLVIKRSFILVTLAIPVALAALIAFTVLVATSGENHLPIGYVDHSGQLDPTRQASLPDAKERIAIASFPNQELALAALQLKQIQAFFVIPADYPKSLMTELYYLDKPPGESAWGDFDDFVRINLLSSYPAESAKRLLEGPEITVHDIANGRDFSSAGIINIIIPIAASFLLLFATLSASGYMLQVVTDEKENRVMEVMITSLTPGQLIGGKAFGLLGVALTQLAIYAGVAIAAIYFAAPFVQQLQHASIPWAYLGVVALFFFPSYALLSAIMLMIGAAVTTQQQGQQIAGMLNLVFMLPLFLLVFIFENPSGLVATLLTLFPPTAFLTVSLRWGLGSVPLWQLALSWVLLVATAGFFIWGAVRVFRVGMLRYGQILEFKSILHTLRLDRKRTP
jgi:ABC-2 type transport system permease protein